MRDSGERAPERVDGRPAAAWTPALVLAAMRRALAREPILPFDGPEPADLIALSEEVLGRESPARLALLVRTRSSGLSIREICRERYTWHRSRATLYRHSDRGARLLADCLNVRGIPRSPSHLIAKPLASETTDLKRSRVRAREAKIHP